MSHSVITQPQQAPEPASPRPAPGLPEITFAVRPGTQARLGLGLTTAGLLWLSYFPVACGWLAWVALVPLLMLVRSPARPAAIYFPAWVAGLAFFWPALQWMRVADERMYATWAFLATYCALYFPLALYLVRFLERRTALPLLLTLPAVWTALEFFRSFFGTGFSWYLLGHSQHDFLPLIQVSDLTGAYGVSFLVVLVNVLLFEVLYARPWFRIRFVGADARPRWRRTGLLAQGVAVLSLMLAAFAYGEWRLRQGAGEPGPRVALLQCNLDQRLKNTGDPDALQVHEAPLAGLAAEYHPDLIVWPETSFPVEWDEVVPGVPTAKCYNSVHARVAPYGTNVLLGLNTKVLCPDRRVRQYNSALLLDRDGRPAGRYDKIHRVPFGEYVPLVEWLPWMNRFAPYDFDYSVMPGTQHTRFPLAQAATGRRCTFGVVICYEDTDADVARPYGGSDGQPPADFLLNISNDGWFNGSSEHEEHLAVCRFRAVELRRSVARAVNMGISAVIDGNGQVLQPRPAGADDLVWELSPDYAGRYPALPVSRWAEYKKVPGVLLADIPLDHRASIYARWGDWLPWGCWALVLGGVGFGLLRGARTGERPA